MTQADEVVRIVRDVLGDDVIGAYAHGSAVLGGLRPTSDLDVLVVSRRRTTTGERRRLVDRVMDVSGRRARRGPARPVELTIVVQSDVRPWRYPPRSEFQYGEWLRADYERGVVPSPGPSADLAPLITMTLVGDTPLFGPPPREVLDSVPVDDLRRAIVEGVPGLLDDLEPDTRNVLLTLARIWSTLATGEIRSKDAAAEWAISRLPVEDRAILADARAMYLGGDEGRWDGRMPRVRSVAARLDSEIERLAPP